MIGTGSIGGKAVGMLLARKIVTNHLPEMQNRMEPHDSFYIGSDVFYTYLVENGWWKLRLAQRTEEGYFSAARELKQNMLEGSFLQSIREQFRRILEYYGQNPIILRSSSLLEDSFGNAFAGKYESMFCANTGNLEERLTAFEYAVKRVYASSMDESIASSGVWITWMSRWQFLSSGFPVPVLTICLCPFSVGLGIPTMPTSGIPTSIQQRG